MARFSSQKIGESSRGLRPSRISIEPSDMRGGRGAIFAARNRFLAVSAPENPKDFSGDCQGVAVAGELAPPSASG